jgi:predicted dehydrogenase
VEKTNIFQYLGIHYVDVIYFATGAKPVRVMATGQEGFLKAQKINALDSIQCSVEWINSTGKKFQSTFHTNWIDPLTTTAMSDQRIKVIGTKGRLESDQKYRGLNIVSDEMGVEEPNPDFCQFYLRPDGKKEIKGYGIDSIHTFLSDVGQIAESKKTPDDFKNIRPTFEQSIIPTKIIEAANLSLKSNSQWIEIK